MHRAKAGPDPVSCQSCRTKKLKCNRVSPCSNCTSRGITCTFPPRGRARRERSQPGTPTPATNELSNSELLKRIERLEAAVLQSNSNHAPNYALDHTPSHAGRSPANAQFAPQVSLTPVSLENAAATAFHDNGDAELQYLENVGVGEPSSLPISSSPHGLIFTIKSIQEILMTQVAIHSQESTVCPEQPTATITLPEHKLAMSLMKSYESTVDKVVRILHMPTACALMETTYLCISQGETIPLGQAALLLSIFSIAAFFHLPPEVTESGTMELDAVCLSKALGKGAMDVLEMSRRTTAGSLEDVQAYILMSYGTYHLEGFSGKCRFFSAAAATYARDLRLHQLDAGEHFCTHETAIQAAIDLEVKRRVFWYVVSTDWMMAAISGPQEGTYMIHPQHINVNLPQDINDDALNLGEISSATDGQGPTSMSYFLERVRLAHICREIADTIPLETSKLLLLQYEKIVTLDQKLEHFLSALPFYFKLDPESRQRSKRLENIYPDLALQRHCITRAVLSRRCKLHQRFLLRQSVDDRYSFSRRVCLDSARAVLQRFDDFTANESSPAIKTAHMSLITHFRHLGLTVLVIDLCFNSSPDQAEIKPLVKSALRKFEDSRNVSPLFGKFLKSLCDTLRKHQVNLNDLPALATDQVANFVNESNKGTLEMSNTGHHQVQAEQFGLHYFDPSIITDATFDDIWHVPFEITPDVDLATWDNLFSVLDSRPL